MKYIKALLVDDETGALNGLQGMLEEFCPQIEVVGAVTSVTQATREMAEKWPDLVFLDIEMPPFNGFDFLNYTRQFQFGVIFTTAYPQYAVQSINLVQPWAYLIKPYSIDDLLAAVSVATIKVKQQQLPSSAAASTDNYGIIIQDSRKGSIVLRAKDILYCKSDGAALEIYTCKNEISEKNIVYRTLKELENQLPETMFCRVHHSFVVNLAFVDRYEISKSNRVVFLKNKVEIPVSIQKADQFVRKLEAFIR
jgi:two-component system LytT family response regulator